MAVPFAVDVAALVARMRREVDPQPMTGWMFFAFAGAGVDHAVHERGRSAHEVCPRSETRSTSCSMRHAPSSRLWLL
ncbi:MAG: hypothetical protein ACLS69_02855 [Butyricicoccus sp.]